MTAIAADVLVPDIVATVREFATTSPYRVRLCETAAGERVVVKSASIPAAVASLDLERRQLDVLGGLRPGRYPRVLAGVPGSLVIEHLPGETVRDLATADPELALSTLLNAVELVFEIAGCRVAPPGDGFVGTQARARAASVRSAAGAVGDDALPAIASRVEEAVAGARLEARLGLAGHGDLTPQNVLVDPLRGAGSFALIDPRGTALWESGLPWWDPLLDLASVVAFHGALDTGSADEEVLRAGVEEALATFAVRARATDAVAAWVDGDRTWLRRLRCYVALRLLGNAAVILTYGGPPSLSRAVAVARVADDVMAEAVHGP